MWLFGRSDEVLRSILTGSACRKKIPNLEL